MLLHWNIEIRNDASRASSCGSGTARSPSWPSWSGKQEHLQQRNDVEVGSFTENGASLIGGGGMQERLGAILENGRGEDGEEVERVESQYSVPEEEELVDRERAGKGKMEPGKHNFKRRQVQPEEVTNNLRGTLRDKVFEQGAEIREQRQLRIRVRVAKDVELTPVASHHLAQG
mmetsp:Transcript_26205/g.74252  ORF Transcript_26205/g.74252 Transcript_26205/m.74252 type:complete len:174 (+) Transcript_26205:92-613(+)